MNAFIGLAIEATERFPTGRLRGFRHDPDDQSRFPSATMSVERQASNAARHSGQLFSRKCKSIPSIVLW